MTEIQEVTTKYFKSDKQFADQIVSEWRATQEAADDIKNKILNDFGVEGLVLKGRNAFGFSKKIVLGEQPEKMRGFKVFLDRIDGEVHAIYQPNGQFKEGKAFKAALNELNAERRKNAGFRDYVVSKLNIETFVISRTGRVYRTQVGVGADVLVVSVSAGGNTDEQYPEMPSFLTEIKKSEFIALTEES